MAGDRVALLLDTDIGTNIDDSLCLCYLLGQPEAELVGLTTVTGDAALRARLASAVCRALSRGDVPIHAGADDPLAGGQCQKLGPQRVLLDRWPHDAIEDRDDAVEFLRATIASRPGEIVLVSIGPLTNIARLRRADPDVIRLLRSHVLMGGRFGEDVPGYGPIETNMRLDPEAAAIVLNDPPIPTWVVGLEVTVQCHLSREAFEARFGACAGGLIGEMAGLWWGDRTRVILHDPLAGAVALDHSLCGWRSGAVRVTATGPEAGLTRLSLAPGAPTRVADRVDSALFLSYFTQHMGASGV